MLKLSRYIVLIMAFSTIVSCKKDFLDEKPSSDLVIPNGLSDLDLMLEDINTTFSFSPEMGEFSSDDYYLPNLASWQAFGDTKIRNCYVWNTDIYEGLTDIDDWNVPYKQIFSCNNILKVLSGINTTDDNRNQWKGIKGSAHFLRAYAYFSLAQIFCLAYDSSTAKEKLGLPIKTDPDINNKVSRSNLFQTYNQIISDLKEAETNIFRDFNDKKPYKPTLLTVYSLFARVYLTMGNYEQAGLYANKAISLKSTLIKFSTLSRTARNPWPVLPQNINPEMIFYDRFVRNFYLSSSNSALFVDSNLIKQYEPNDLRKTIYFRSIGSNLFTLKASYINASYCFTGLAVDEMYLISSESSARAGDFQTAMKTLNVLLKSRWEVDINGQSTYVDKNASNRKHCLL
ncbi:RagB/SusD family nutrient uptake outer membrane protein [uncultured Chitinophaga sp.]|uniref:RagB/SusD family nutrient uptake outer membrane protein n=1 Tax=uncultured Chitinophaga sp. TaxID=339340 RepID=UPI00260C1FAF|nr:RagB/SusD family nutrient uptake outer membrane protein [uncultured Chitinophaga sp.]